MLNSFESLRRQAAAGQPRRVAIAGADSATALTALAAAVQAGVATPVLVGDEAAIRELIQRESLGGLRDAEIVPARSPEAAAEGAAALASSGGADVILKGSVRTDQLLRAVLDRRAGLRTGRLLSDVLLYEDTLAGERRLVGVTDGGINVSPDEAALRQIVANAVAVFRAIGFERPRVAMLTATEAVSESVPSTVLARAVALAATSGELGACEVVGPIALDGALLASAARAKGIDHPAAGRADILVAPGIEAGNILGKAVKYLGGSTCAHVVVGARVPVLIPSRVESAEDKLNSIALGALVHGIL
jgi:phosphate butyryltransferase